MIKQFEIRTKKRKFIFKTTTALEDFIDFNKAHLKGKSIILVDDQGKDVGNIAVDSYIKLSNEERNKENKPA